MMTRTKAQLETHQKIMNSKRWEAKMAASIAAKRAAQKAAK